MQLFPMTLRGFIISNDIYAAQILSPSTVLSQKFNQIHLLSLNLLTLNIHTSTTLHIRILPMTHKTAHVVAAKKTVRATYQ